MGIDEKLYKAILESHKDDLRTILHYVRWVKIRRLVNHRFYFDAHWMQSGKKYHWLGRRA